METLFYRMVTNGVVVLMLLPVVWLLCRAFRKQPATQNLLWLLLLAKLTLAPILIWSFSFETKLFDFLASKEPTENAPAIATTRFIVPPVVSYHSQDIVAVPEIAQSTEIPLADVGTQEIAAQNSSESLVIEEPTQSNVILSSDITTQPLENTRAAAATQVIAASEAAAPPSPIATANPEKPVTDFPFLASILNFVRSSETVWYGSMIWLAGCLGFGLNGLRKFWATWTLVKSSQPCSPAMTEIAQSVASQFRLKRIEVREVAGLDSPCVVAFGRAKILWPTEMNPHAQGCRAIVAHEIVHIKRRDHWAMWLEMLAGVMWWWNPACYFIRRRLHETRELACDAVALAQLGEEPRDYAQKLIDLTTGQSFRASRHLPACSVGAVSKNSLQRRLVMLFEDRIMGRTSRLGLLVGLLIAALIVPTFVLGEPKEPAQKQKTADSKITEPAENSKAESTSPSSAIVANQEESNVEATVTEFMKAFASSDSNKAESFLTPKAKREITAAKIPLISSMNSTTGNMQFKIISKQLQNENEKQLAFVTCEVTDATSSQREVRYQHTWALRKESDAWRIVGMENDLLPGVLIDLEDGEAMKQKFAEIDKKNRAKTNTIQPLHEIIITIGGIPPKGRNDLIFRNDGQRFVVFPNGRIRFDSKGSAMKISGLTFDEATAAVVAEMTRLGFENPSAKLSAVEMLPEQKEYLKTHRVSKIAVGDNIYIEIAVGDQVCPDDYSVRPIGQDGMFEIFGGKYGRIRVVGKTPSEIENELVDLIAKTDKISKDDITLRIEKVLDKTLKKNTILPFDTFVLESAIEDQVATNSHRVYGSGLVQVPIRYEFKGLNGSTSNIILTVRIIGLTIEQAEKKIQDAIYERRPLRHHELKDIGVQITQLRHDEKSLASFETQKNHIIKPGEEIFVDSRMDSPAQKITVEEEGTLALGARYGRVNVAGMTMLEAHDAISAQFRKKSVGVDPTFNLWLVEKPKTLASPFNNGPAVAKAEAPSNLQQAQQQQSNPSQTPLLYDAKAPFATVAQNPATFNQSGISQPKLKRYNFEIKFFSGDPNGSVEKGTIKVLQAPKISADAFQTAYCHEGADPRVIVPVPQAAGLAESVIYDTAGRTVTVRTLGEADGKIKLQIQAVVTTSFEAKNGKVNLSSSSTVNAVNTSFGEPNKIDLRSGEPFEGLINKVKGESHWAEITVTEAQPNANAASSSATDKVQGFDKKVEGKSNPRFTVAAVRSPNENVPLKVKDRVRYEVLIQNQGDTNLNDLKVRFTPSEEFSSLQATNAAKEFNFRSTPDHSLEWTIKSLAAHSTFQPAIIIELVCIKMSAKDKDATVTAQVTCEGKTKGHVLNQPIQAAGSSPPNTKSVNPDVTKPVTTTTNGAFDYAAPLPNESRVRAVSPVKIYQVNIEQYSGDPSGSLDKGTLKKVGGPTIQVVDGRTFTFQNGGEAPYTVPQEGGATKLAFKTLGTSITGQITSAPKNKVRLLFTFSDTKQETNGDVAGNWISKGIKVIAQSDSAQSENESFSTRSVQKSVLTNLGEVVKLEMHEKEKGIKQWIELTVTEVLEPALAPQSVPAAPKGRPVAKNTDAADLIQPGDELKVHAMGGGSDLIKDTFTVEPAGTIPLGPEYGRVNVVGKTIDEAEKIVDEVLHKQYNVAYVQITRDQAVTKRKKLRIEAANISIEYAKKATEVALTRYKKYVEANKVAPNSVGVLEIEDAKLSYERGKLEIKRAEIERALIESGNDTSPIPEKDKPAANDQGSKKEIDLMQIEVEEAENIVAREKWKLDRTKESVKKGEVDEVHLMGAQIEFDTAERRYKEREAELELAKKREKVAMEKRPESSEKKLEVPMPGPAPANENGR